MANYSAIKAAVNAYIKANGKKEITGHILNSVLNATIDSLGRYFQFAGGALPTDDPGTPDQNVCYLAGEPGVYTNFGGITIENEEVALLFWNGEWTKQRILIGIQEVEVSVDNQVGTPSVDVSYSGGQLVLTFHNLKGETGDAAGFGTIGADINGGVGTPGVSVESSGDNTAKNLMFHFTNLKGETGVTSVVATIDDTSGTPSCQVSLVNGVLTLAFSGLKGIKGDTGVSADYPITLYNGLDSDATDQALTAAQGKVLDGKISQLGQQVHNLDKQINGGSDTYEADIETTSASYVRPTIHYAEVDIPQGTYNLSANLNGTFANVIVYFYDEDDTQITGIKDKDNRDYNYVSTGNFTFNPFTFPTGIKKIGLYQDNKITDGTIEIMLSSVATTGIVGDISEIKDDIQSLETNKASKAEVEEEVERLEGEIESVSESLNHLETEVEGEDKSKSISINFIANVPITGAGSQYPTEFSLKAGTYNLTCSGKPAGLSPFSIYFYDDENNRIVVTDNIGETYNSMALPLYDSRQPFTFPTDVASIKFYGGTPSENFTLVFNAQDTNKDQSLRELLGDIDVTPDVVLPKKLYLLSSSVDTIENSIYHKHYMSFQNPRFGIDIRRGFKWRTSPRFLRTKANGTIQSPTIYLYDVPNRKVLKTITPNVITGLKETNNGAKVINCIGDSFTYNGVWFNHINELCSNLTFVGMRHSYNAGETLRAEGRGGWRLSDYFEPHGDVTPTHMQPFSPFMHVNGYTYYGVIDFWKVIVNDDSQYTYGTDGFDDYKSWFDTNGYKINPPTNALMYDGVNDKYVYYNGSSWADFNGTPTFVFDYAKYISTWNITSPDFVMIMLGTNDFGGNNAISDADWIIWKNRMDEVISSIRTYAASVSKSIVIGLCTPTVRYGAENSSYGVNQDIYSYGTFDGRKRIINTFETSSYEAIEVYVVDTGTAVDTEYGFEEWNTEVNELPFSYYTGSFREVYGYNDPHPSAAGYKQIGVVGAAFIQAKR